MNRLLQKFVSDDVDKSTSIHGTSHNNYQDEQVTGWASVRSQSPPIAAPSTPGYDDVDLFDDSPIPTQQFIKENIKNQETSNEYANTKDANANITDNFFANTLNEDHFFQTSHNMIETIENKDTFVNTFEQTNTQKNYTNRDYKQHQDVSAVRNKKTEDFFNSFNDRKDQKEYDQYNQGHITKETTNASTLFSSAPQSSEFSWGGNDEDWSIQPLESNDLFNDTENVSKDTSSDRNGQQTLHHEEKDNYNLNYGDTSFESSVVEEINSPRSLFGQSTNSSPFNSFPQSNMEFSNNSNANTFFGSKEVPHNSSAKNFETYSQHDSSNANTFFGSNEVLHTSPTNGFETHSQHDSASNTFFGSNEMRTSSANNFETTSQKDASSANTFFGSNASLSQHDSASNTLFGSNEMHASSASGFETSSQNNSSTSNLFNNSHDSKVNDTYDTADVSSLFQSNSTNDDLFASSGNGNYTPHSNFSDALSHQDIYQKDYAIQSNLPPSEEAKRGGNTSTFFEETVAETSLFTHPSVVEKNKHISQNNEQSNPHAEVNSQAQLPPIGSHQTNRIEKQEPAPCSSEALDSNATNDIKHVHSYYGFHDYPVDDINESTVEHSSPFFASENERNLKHDEQSTTTDLNNSLQEAESANLQNNDKQNVNLDQVEHTEFEHTEDTSVSKFDGSASSNIPSSNIKHEMNFTTSSYESEYGSYDVTSHQTTKTSPDSAQTVNAPQTHSADQAPNVYRSTTSSCSSVASSRLTNVSEDAIRLSEMYKSMADRLQSEKNDLLNVLADQAEQFYKMQDYIASLERQIQDMRVRRPKS